MTSEQSTNSWPGGYWEPAYIPQRGQSVDQIIEACIQPYSGGTALEIGTGAGFWANHLAGRFERVIACDVIPKASRFDGFCSHANVTYLTVPDGGSLEGVADRSIDFVWSYDVLCHLSQTATISYLQEIGRVLKPGGHACLMLPCWERHPYLNVIPIPPVDQEYSSWYHHDFAAIADSAPRAGLALVNSDVFPDNRDRLIILKGVAMLCNRQP